MRPSSDTSIPAANRELVELAAQFAASFARWLDVETGDGLTYTRLGLLEHLHCFVQELDDGRLSTHRSDGTRRRRAGRGVIDSCGWRGWTPLDAARVGASGDGHGDTDEPVVAVEQILDGRDAPAAVAAGATGGDDVGHRRAVAAKAGDRAVVDRGAMADDHQSTLPSGDVVSNSMSDTPY
jgi:hypothetical protein